MNIGIISKCERWWSSFCVVAGSKYMDFGGMLAQGAFIMSYIIKVARLLKSMFLCKNHTGQNYETFQSCGDMWSWPRYKNVHTHLYALTHTQMSFSKEWWEQNHIHVAFKALWFLTAFLPSSEVWTKALTHSWLAKHRHSLRAGRVKEDINRSWSHMYAEHEKHYFPNVSNFL